MLEKMCIYILKVLRTKVRVYSIFFRKKYMDFGSVQQCSSLILVIYSSVQHLHFLPFSSFPTPLESANGDQKRWCMVA